MLKGSSVHSHSLFSSVHRAQVFSGLTTGSVQLLVELTLFTREIFTGEEIPCSALIMLAQCKGTGGAACCTYHHDPSDHSAPTNCSEIPQRRSPCGAGMPAAPPPPPPTFMLASDDMLPLTVSTLLFLFSLPVSVYVTLTIICGGVQKGHTETETWPRALFLFMWIL